MKKLLLSFLALMVLTGSALAQGPVTPGADHDAMLRHAEPKLAANKRFVYDFRREVFEAAHMELAVK